MSARNVEAEPVVGRRIRGLDAAERARQRRELLLSTALELFARDGFAQTSIETLCQTAYVGNKAFYDNFTSKEDCYLALFQRSTDHMLTAAADAVGDDVDDEAVVSERVVRAFLDALMGDVRVPIVLFGQAGGVSPAIERQRRVNRRAAAELVSGLWERFGVARTDFSDAMAVAVIGGIFDLIADLLDRTDGSPDAADHERLATDVIAFVSAVRAGMAMRG